MAEKQYLYIGHYYDIDGNFILKVGTTNDLDKRQKQHNTYYKRKAANNPMAENSSFIYDWHHQFVNVLEYEAKVKEHWKEEYGWTYIRNDRFNCGRRPTERIEVKIRKTYHIWTRKEV